MRGLMVRSSLLWWLLRWLAIDGLRAGGLRTEEGTEERVAGLRAEPPLGRTSLEGCDALRPRCVGLEAASRLGAAE